MAISDGLDLNAPPPHWPGAHPTVWELSYRVFVDHAAGTDGWCITCREPRLFSPCRPRIDAHAGFVVALTWGDQSARALVPQQRPAAEPPPLG
jgi:hypothetical protein